MAKHAFCHVEWATTDLDKAKAFYEGLFGWSFSPWGNEYLMFKTPNSELGGGLMLMKEFQPGMSPCVYIHVDSIEPYLEKAAALGGGVCMGKTEIPQMGWFAILFDSDKNQVGLFEPSPKK